MPGNPGGAMAFKNILHARAFAGFKKRWVQLGVGEFILCFTVDYYIPDKFQYFCAPVLTFLKSEQSRCLGYKIGGAFTPDKFPVV